MLRELILAGILTSAAAGAVADENRGFTFGIGVAETYYDLNPSATAGVTGSDHATGWETFAGYRFNRYLGLEATYFDGGEIRTSLFGVDVKLTGKGYGASFLGTLPVNQSFAVFGRVGYMAGELKAKWATGIYKSDDDTPVFGAGIQTMMDVVHVRLEYTRAEFELLDANRVSLNLAWLF